MSDTDSRTGGRRVIVVLYVGITLLTGALGFVIGYIGPQGLDPELYGVIQLPPTPFGTALYGAATIATILGVLLLGVVYVAERYDDTEAGRAP